MEFGSIITVSLVVVVWLKAICCNYCFDNFDNCTNILPCHLNDEYVYIANLSQLNYGAHKLLWAVYASDI